MKFIVIASLVLGSQIAKADGFVCVTEGGDLKVQAYNHVTPEIGTRTAAVMVLSDPRVSAGRKTIARFSAERETLSGGGAYFLADVDLRYSDSSRRGELVGGTKLGHIDTIELAVDFNYGQPVEAEEVVAGELFINKRNGETIALDVECARYLKQE